MNEDPCKETMVRHKRKNMERPIFYLFAIGLLASSCGKGGQGQLIGAQGRPGWYDVDPYGMNYVPMGAFVMGPSDQDVPCLLYTSDAADE